MKEETLKQRMTKLRSRYEVVLPDTPYIMAMIDGKNFSRLIKNCYGKPFDPKFMDIMDKTAIYVCQAVQYACFAYVQSDEITFVFDNHSNGDCHQNFFGNRISKLLSIIPATATAKFNSLITQEILHNPKYDKEEMIGRIESTQLKVFDCKVWTATNFNDVYAYLLWRQRDCIRNSKQQAAQAYFSHKKLHGLDTDQQVELLLDERGIDWYTHYTDGMKFGRFIYKDQIPYHSEEYGDYIRNVWNSHPGFVIGGQKLLDLNVIPYVAD